jgi:hypothetical protein
MSDIITLRFSEVDDLDVNSLLIVSLNNGTFELLGRPYFKSKFSPQTKQQLCSMHVTRDVTKLQMYNIE